MKKKANVKTLIRQIVREEVAMAIKEVIVELKKPTTTPIPQQRQVTEAVGKELNYSKNSVLNEVLNETAKGDSWKTMGGGTYDSSKINDVMSSQYGEMMSGTQQQVPSSDPMSQFVNKDYRAVLKAVDKKQGK